MPQAADSRTAAIRRFNRFYTRRIGVLHEKLADTRFSLTESRLLWELAHRGRTTAAELARDLDLDPGYLSRLLRALKDQKLITRERSASDARHLHLGLSAAGRRAFAPLDRQSEADAAALLAALPDGEQRRLVAATAAIESILSERPRGGAPWLLRSPQPGDIGWVVERHGRLYADEYGWDTRFEALVARIGADFIERFDAGREACWIAERDGVNVGSVFLVQARDDATGAVVEGSAQLRLLLVEPAARGLGSAPASSTNASDSRAPRATGASFSGPTACCWRRAPSTPRPATGGSRARRTRASAIRWSAKPGSSPWPDAGNRQAPGSPGNAIIARIAAQGAPTLETR